MLLKNVFVNRAWRTSTTLYRKCVINTEQNIDCSKKRNIIELEIDVLQQEGFRVPSNSFLKKDHWEHLCSLNSKSARRKYYAFLWQIEKKKLRRAEKLFMKEDRLIVERKRNEFEKIDYFSRNSFLLRIYDSTINVWNNNRLIQAMQFGPKIIFDCSYCEYMTKRENINAAKQLMLCFATNRSHMEPYDMHFCNVDYKDITMKYLQKHIPTISENYFPLHLHEKCFTDMFSKEQLIYLTPHCKEDLTAYNYNDIYVIGCIVDKVNNEPLSVAKAKRLGLRTARLPLEKYLQWRPGSGKSLTLNQVMDILLDFKISEDWHLALRHVPSRKKEVFVKDVLTE